MPSIEALDRIFGLSEEQKERLRIWNEGLEELLSLPPGTQGGPCTPEALRRFREVFGGDEPETPEDEARAESKPKPKKT